MTRFLSVCSGLEGASLAAHAIGWTCAGVAEIEAFPSAIIAHRLGSNMPGEPLSGNAPPNFGDFTTIDLARLGPVEMLIGGTPCQAFSIAGKRLSLADARGNLTLAYAVLAHELARSNGLRNCLWENVPGCLNTPDNAFGCFLGALVGSDDAIRLPAQFGSWPDEGMVEGPRARAAWRILDAQYFGLAQRRERVFVVADFGNGADPVEVLFEPQGLRGNSAPRREKREGIAPTLSARTKGGGGLGTDFDCDGGLIARPLARCVTTGEGSRQDFETTTLIAHSLRGEGFDASEDGTGRGTPPVAVAFNWQAGGTQTALGFDPESEVTSTLQAEPIPAIAFSSKDFGADATVDLSPTLRSIQTAVAFAQNTRDEVRLFGGDGQTVGALAAEPGMKQQSYVATQWAVRRLTPRECERLQGVPDDWTKIPWRGKPADLCPDGPRYKALGNSWAVPVVAWIFRRLDASLSRKDAA